MLEKNPSNTTKRAMSVLLAVMFINSLSYGVMIPLLYPYASRFGINAFGLSMLFASFSLFQFFATPIFGRLSDKYGRKPLLLISLFGTAVSQSVFALATTAPILFIARIFDGITGGNNSVASAIAADISKPEDRAKTFGLLGSAQGFGFVAGPALGGLISNFGLSAPFWFSAAIALLATVAGIFWLPETLPDNVERVARKEAFFNMSKLLGALKLPIIGPLLTLSLIVSLGHNVFVLSFQTYTVDTLGLNSNQIGVIFTIVGSVIAFMQAVGIKMLIEWFKSEKKIVVAFLTALTLVMIPNGFVKSIWLFSGLTVLYGFSFSPIFPILSSQISKQSKQEDQGGMMGIQQAIFSLAQIFGPVLAGLVAGYYSALPYLLAAGIFGFGLVTALKLPERSSAKADL